MLEYETIRKNRRKFLALTGLTVEEFQELLPAFVTAYEQRSSPAATRSGHPRQRRVGGGRIGRLSTAEQKSLFILVYQKTYPLQVVLGELFALSQPSANQ